MKNWITIASFLVACGCLNAQGFKNGKLYLNEEGTQYFKITALSQAWVRYQDYNPGTTIFGYAKDRGADVGVRRFRLQFIGQVTDRIFVYGQIGENNFNNIGSRKLGFFVHDAYGELALVKDRLAIGAGLSAWSGLARFASPSIGSIMGIDAPLYQQSTNDVTDQFLRKLSLHAKGKLGRLDYRIALSHPMAIQQSASYQQTLTTAASFSAKPPAMETNAYVMYQFHDQESNLTPYTTGTYLGTKSVFNIGAGIVYQPRAMWRLSEQDNRDTVEQAMLQIAADVFYDAPIGDKGGAVSCYGALSWFDFGRNYLRNSGVMNPANGDNRPELLNGGGNNFPLVGTGPTLYLQAGYKIPGRVGLMPYAAWQHSNYERLQVPVDFYDIGLNVLLKAHTGKITIAYQNRPLFHTNGKAEGRRGAVLMQLQAALL